MELNEHGFLEELLSLRRDTLETFPTEMNDLFLSSFDYFDQNPAFNNVFPNSYTFNENYSNPFSNDQFSAPQLTDSYSSLNTLDTSPFPVQEEYPLATMEEELSILGDEIHNLEVQASCKVEPIQSPEAPVFNVGNCLEGKNRAKKLQGQPSKNLMAERRRRKRLNDRLSMLRSIVPKISKMDRTSILGDTIDYMKELLEKINNLQQEIEVNSNMQMGIFNNVKPNETLVRNSPKFDVERRNVDTRIEICCAGKPGLLLSSVNTLEALGLEIEQCVISCFNDFAMQASCSEELEQRTILSSEDIKQELFRNAGYGGRCL